MQQTVRPQTYSPAEVLEAGRRAEAEGRRDYAAQFYRHLTEYYASSAEAVEARYGLQRLSVVVPQPALRPQMPMPPYPQDTPAPARPALDDSYTPPGASPSAQQQAPPAPPVSLPVPARGFPVGRCIAWLLLGLGGLLTLAGVAVLGYALSQGLFKPTPAGASAIVVAPSLIAGGLFLALVGELCRAAFRAANAASDLAAIQRALAQSEVDEHGGG